MQLAMQSVDLLLAEKLGSLTETQRQGLHAIQAALQRLTRRGERDSSHPY
jgi:hypothetical protein